MKKSIESINNFLKRLGGQAATWVVSMTFLIFVGRILTKVELAAIPVYLIIDSASQAISNLGVMPTCIKKVPMLIAEEKRKEAAAMLKTYFFIPIIPLALISGSVFLFSQKISILFFNRQGYAFLIKYMALGLVFSGMNIFLSHGVRALQRFGVLSVGQTIVSVIQRGVAITLYLFFGIKGIILGFIFGSLIGFFFYSYHLKDIFFLESGFYPPRRLISYSFPYYIDGLARYLTLQGDQLVIGTFLEPASLAAYFLARKFFEILYLIISALGEAVVPKIAELSAQGNKTVESGYHKLVRYYTFFNIPLCFLFVGLSPFFINIIGGNKYKEAVLPAIILSLVALVYSFKSLTEMGVFILGRPIERLKFELINSSLLLIFTTTLIQVLDLPGVALGRLFAVATAFIYGIFALRKFINLKFDPIALKITVFASLVLAGILLILQYIYYNIFVIPLYLVLGLSVFMFIFSRQLEQRDISLFMKLLPSRFKRLISVFYIFGGRKLTREVVIQ